MSSPSAEPTSNEAPTTIAEQFVRARRVFASEPCLLTPDGWLTFHQVGEAADGARRALLEAGSAPDDRIVLALPNSAVLRILEQGVFEGGLVRVAISPRLHAREIAAIALDAEASIVCCAPAAADEITAALAELSVPAQVLSCADDDAPITPRGLRAAGGDAPPPGAPSPNGLAMLLYSSGTTGTPKGATVTHAAWIEQWHRAMAQLPPIGPGDIVLAVAPMTHFAGSIGLDCAVAGAATIPLTYGGPAATLREIARRRPTILPLAPVLLTDLATAAGGSDQAALSGLRVVPYGGSPIAPTVLADAARILPGRLVQFYGLAEALAPLACLSAAEHDAAVRRLDSATDPAANDDAEERRVALAILSSAGRWVPGVAARVADTELLVSGDVVTAGYWKREQLNGSVFHDGWFATGDLVRFDGDRLTVLSRADDLVVSGGFNVYPGEVERVLSSEPGVRDVAVIGLPHPRWGSGLVAAVVLDEATRVAYSGDSGHARLLDVLAARTRTSLAGFKKPLAVHILTELPRNAAGKIDRNRLRERLTAPESDNHAST